VKNVTAKLRGFSPELSTRIDACAYIAMADSPDKVRGIRAAQGLEGLDAGRVYVRAVLNSFMRKGMARTYAEALERLEYAQAGDRGDMLDKAVNTWNTGGAGHSHAWNSGRALGTLYTGIEAGEEALDPANMAYNGAVVENLTAFFAMYIAGLSGKTRAGINEFARHVAMASGGDMLKAEQVIRGITSNKGKAEPGTRKLADFAANLHRNFEHKNAVTCPELMGLLLNYGNAGTGGAGTGGAGKGSTV
jgi:hypothetical protein